MWEPAAYHCVFLSRILTSFTSVLLLVGTGSNGPGGGMPALELVDSQGVDGERLGLAGGLTGGVLGRLLLGDGFEVSVEHQGVVVFQVLHIAMFLCLNYYYILFIGILNDEAVALDQLERSHAPQDPPTHHPAVTQVSQPQAAGRVRAHDWRHQG